MRGKAASSKPASPTAALATMATPRKAFQPRALTPRASARKPSAHATAAISAPKAATMVAPVGRSQGNDANRPATLTTAPTAQPMASGP